MRRTSCIRRGICSSFNKLRYGRHYLLIRPKLYQAVIIGLITGIISQIPMLNATPLVNLASETLGALVCGILSTIILMAPYFKDNEKPGFTGWFGKVINGLNEGATNGACRPCAR